MKKKRTNAECESELSELDEKYSKYAANYSDTNFNQKIETDGKHLGTKLISYSKFLYYLVTDKESPVDAKLKKIIYGALGYLILPIDLIPDFLPIGFTDDFAAIAAVIAAVAKFALSFKDDPVKVEAFNRLRIKAGLDPMVF